MVDTSPESVRVLHTMSFDTVGGVETMVLGSLGASREGPMEQHVLVLRRRCHPLFGRPLRQLGSRVHYSARWAGLPVPRSFPSLWRRNLRRLLRAARPDVVVVHDWLRNPLLWQELVQGDRKMVYFEHGIAWTDRGRKVMGQYAPRCETVICVSHAARRMLELRWAYPRGLCTFCTRGPRLPLMSGGEPRKAPDPHRPMRLAVAARLVPSKGVALAVHALHILRSRGCPCELHVAGTGRSGPSLKALAARLGLEEVAFFHGVVSDMRNFYQRADLFLCPSVAEPLGNVCVEAAHFGLPVLCNAVDGMPEAVADGVTGFCVKPTLALDALEQEGQPASRLPQWVYDPSTDSLMPPLLLDPEAIAHKVLLLRGDPALYEQMSRAACERAASCFRFEDYVTGFDRLLLDVVGGRPGG